MEENKSKIQKYWKGLGRRKTAVATVRIYEENKDVILNGASKELTDRMVAPFELVGKKGNFGVSIKVHGGGKSGQEEAITIGIAKALEEYNSEFRSILKKAGYLTRDSREKERKKPGLKRARRAPQWAKR